MMEAHAGIIIVPNGRDMGLEETTEIVAELTAFVDETSMRGRLFEWVGSGGWSEWRG